MITGWTASTTSFVGTCGFSSIIGGYNIFGEGAWAKKTYEGLPGHNSVTVEWDAYFIDGWGDTGNDDKYLLDVDEINRYSMSYKKNYYSLMNHCGSSDSDYFTEVSTSSFNHNSSTITLYFHSTLNQTADSASFGFRNIKITVDVICTPACATCYGNDISECYTCNTGWYLLNSTCMTDCGAGLWNNPSGNVCSGDLLYFSSSK